MTTEKEIRNNAFYHEVCILRLLRDIGMLTQKEYAGIVKIAAEDYNANLKTNMS